MVENKFYKTKLCQSYQRGRCTRHNCNFAHGDAELRRFLDNPHGRRDYRIGDLREKLDRGHSPRQRHTTGRHARGHNTYHGHYPSKSLEDTRDRKRRKKEHLDGGSDFSGSIRMPDGIDIQGKHTSLDSKIALDEQLKEVQSDIEMLDQHRIQLGVYMEEKVQEADSLMSRIKELEAQLGKEKEDCRRITSKIKTFVKVHNRYSKAQDELKRSQLRLDKLGEQLNSGTARTDVNEEDSSINILSDGETTCYHRGSPRNEKQNHPSPVREMLHLNGDFASVPEGFEKNSLWSIHPARLNFDKEAFAVENENIDNMPQPNGGKLRRERSRKSSRDKSKSLGSHLVLPPTGMAAHAGDEVVEEDKIVVVEPSSRGTEKGHTYKGTGMSVSIRPPPRKNYSQRVDVEGLEETIGTEII